MSTASFIASGRPVDISGAVLSESTRTIAWELSQEATDIMRKTKRHGLTVDDPEALGQRIAALRDQRGVTQAEISEKLGISQALMSQYEHGRLRPNAALIIELARILKVSADEILGLDKSGDDDAKPNRRILRRVEQIESLPRRKREALLQTIDAFLKGAEA